MPRHRLPAIRPVERGRSGVPIVSPPSVAMRHEGHVDPFSVEGKREPLELRMGHDEPVALLAHQRHRFALIRQ